MTLFPGNSGSPELGNTAVVVVTYGNRYEFVKEVVQAIMDIGLSKVIIVDNGSPAENRSKIKRHFQSRQHDVDIIHLPMNTGSAGGFYAGLKHAQGIPSVEFVWMLDDDNKPKRDAFLKLCQAYSLLGNSPQFTFVSLRRSRCEYLRAAALGERVGIQCGSFLGFDAIDWLKSRVKWRKTPRPSDEAVYQNPLVSVEYAPYGGFFFHKSWLSRVGLPKRCFFLYSDDHEFTMRIRDNGGQIFLCAPSELEELEVSWGGTEGGSRSIPLLMRADIDEQKIYHFVRNRVYLENVRCGGRPIYWLNACISLARVSTLAVLIERRPKKVVARLQLIVRAIKNGRDGKFLN